MTMTTTVLVDPAWLAEHLCDADVRVVEVDVSAASYDDWHVDSATLWNIYADLKDAAYRPVDAAAFERLLARSGIEPSSTVVFYGYAPAFGFWLMKLYGHRDLRILNCSRDYWRAAGLPWSQTPSTPRGDRYRLAGQDSSIRADHVAVRHALDDPSVALLDVRSGEEYDGERFWPSGGLEPGGRAGHLPRATHQPLDGLFDDRGAFRDTTGLRAALCAVDIDGQQELITYCTIGGRAATAWFALTQLLGRANVRVYDGSWAEWGRMPDTPVERPANTHPPQKGETIMAGLIRKSLDAPEEVRPFADGSGHLDLVNLDAGAVGRATFEPGWRWSEHVKPIAGTDSCQAAHTCYFVAGRMAVVMDDGEQLEYGPGDFAIMPPGHDAWTVGDEPCVVVDWQGFAEYARPKA